MPNHTPEGLDSVDNVVEQWAKEKPQLDTLSMASMGRLARLSKHLEQGIAVCHNEHELKAGEFDVLATLRRSGGDYCLTPSALLASMMLTSGAMTHRLDRLESKALIVRVHSKQDRRSVSVALSDSGLTLIDKVIESHVETQNKLMGALTDVDKFHLNQLLKKCLFQFER
ncbi:MarR family transcriptional regulator [Shewanella sp. VB17]|uniref:MarR family winged helix-turn-helix transcriptional regulator n=1 Tax=Shewanella sp. VB17 TaxID=2739432 RepID=UPI001566B23B|nr:MarR family transcriptional regulator [Shewanella sp. VB17]NRD72507.1 MarR family transcriptional regulator [Shewanella sp. VB17]